MTTIIEGESSWAITASYHYVIESPDPVAIVVRPTDAALFAQPEPEGEARQEWIDMANGMGLPLWIGERKAGDATAPFLLGPESVTMFARFPRSVRFPYEEQDFARRLFSRMSEKIDGCHVNMWFMFDANEDLVGVARWTSDEYGYTLQLHIFIDSYQDPTWANGLPINECAGNQDVGRLDLTLARVVELIQETIKEEFNYSMPNVDVADDLRSLRFETEILHRSA